MQTIEQWAALLNAAREVTRWDWLHLLSPHPDSDVVRADIQALESAVEAIEHAAEHAAERSTP